MSSSKPGDPGRETIGPPEAQLEAPLAGEAPVEYEDVERGPLTARTATAIGLVCAGLIAFALLWIAGEMHYRNCIDTAQLRAEGQNPEVARLVRTQAADTCSRSPF